MTIWRFSRWRMSAILNFRGSIMGSLKSPCRTSYRSSVETIALNCLVFEKIAFLCTHFGDGRTNGQTRRTASMCKGASRCCEHRLKKATVILFLNWAMKLELIQFCTQSVYSACESQSRWYAAVITSIKLELCHPVDLSVNHSVCRSVCRITALVTNRFHLNLALWLGWLTNHMQWLTFGGNPVTNTDFRSLSTSLNIAE